MNLVSISNGKSHHVPYRDSKLTFLLQVNIGFFWVGMQLKIRQQCSWYIRWRFSIQLLVLAFYFCMDVDQKKREDEIQGLKMRLRFREAAIKRLKSVALGKISAKIHLLKEKEEHLK